MTTTQAIEYEKIVINSAKDWINGEASIDNQEHLRRFIKRWRN